MCRSKAAVAYLTGTGTPEGNLQPSVTALLMSAEAILFAAGVVTFLTVVGFGLTELLLPKADGFGLLLAPVVGLAVSALGFQWLSELAPPFMVAVFVLVVFGALSLVVGWRRRATLTVRVPELLGATASILAFYLALLQIVIQRGYFTLGGLASDNAFIYVQAAQYLRDHPIPSALHAVGLENPGSLYFASSGVTFFPNSVGQIDAAASVLSGWPVHVVFDPLSALCVALAIGPVWFLVRVGLGGSLWTGLAAAAVLATNQLMYWLVGSGYQQEAEALPVFLAALAIAAHAWRNESSRAGGLAGMVAGALPGLYLAIAALFAVAAFACLVASTVIGSPEHRTRLLRPLGWAIGAGLASAGIAIYILAFRGGLATWFSIVGGRYAAGGISSFPALPYVLGTLPFAHVWEQTLRPLKTYERLIYPALILASAAMVALLLIGQVRAILQRRAPEAALLAGGMLFVAYEVAIAGYPYGYVKAIGLLAPLTSVFIAFGAVGLESLFKSPPRTTVRKAIGPLAVLTLLFVLAGSTLASRDMAQAWLAGPPTFTNSYLSQSNLASAVPVGASVFVDDRTDDYRTLVKVAAIAYFLPDRQVRIFTGDFRMGTFPPYQNVRPQPCRFDYVIAAAPPEGNFALVYPDPSVGLDVYKRLGAACG